MLFHARADRSLFPHHTMTRPAVVKIHVSGEVVKASLLPPISLPSFFARTTVATDTTAANKAERYLLLRNLQPASKYRNMTDEEMKRPIGVWGTDPKISASELRPENIRLIL